MSDFLRSMAAASVRRAAGLRPRELRAQVSSAPPSIPLRLPEAGFDVIAEVKLDSPSQGRLVPGGADDAVGPLAREYEGAGAAAISVLTEPARFGGSLEHLSTVVGAVDVPVMRKDFLVDPVQVIEARAAGASGVLLIARMLPGKMLMEMTEQAEQLGMFVLVEVFDRSDLDSAATVFDREVLVGVNCRDLATLEVDTRRFHAIRPHLPDHLQLVAESGLAHPSDMAEVATLGYRLALVGTALVSVPDPASRLSDLIEAGRQAIAAARR